MTAPVQVGPSSTNGGPVPSPVQCLTARHLQILHLAANGYSNKMIGARLGTAENTIKSQMAAIMRRLRVGDRTQAVTVALRLGWISLDKVDLPGHLAHRTGARP